MIRGIVALACLLSNISPLAPDDKTSRPSYTYDVARTHEIKPRPSTIPLEGVQPGASELRLKLTVSPAGDVLDAEASGEQEVTKFWPQLQDEVRLFTRAHRRRIRSCCPTALAPFDNSFTKNRLTGRSHPDNIQPHG